MRFHRDLASIDFAATLSQVTDEFFTRIELRARWLIAIKIADQADAERNIVQIIAMHMPPIDLAPPAIADFDLPIASGCSVPNHEMIRKTILHSPDMPMIIVKRARVSLPGAAIVDDYELPASAFYWRASKGFDD